MVDRSPITDATLDAAAPHDVQATFCATLVDEWLRRGVRHAVVAPGSRSTPLALALAARSEMTVHVVHDERVAGFVALGIATASPVARDDSSIGSVVPALLVCTSGTAAANFLPAVVEAGLSGVPMIVLTADRPDELRGVGAPQTIDQIDLYGSHVRWFADPGVPDAEGAGGWRSLAATAVAAASDGPVQLNLAFREPLVGTALDLPTPDSDLVVAASSTSVVVDPIPVGFGRPRGVILFGGASGVDPKSVAELQRLTSWPIIADPMSRARHLEGVITSADAILRHEGFAADHVPDVIVRVGRPSSSKVLAQWSARPGITVIQVGGPGRIDPDHNVAAVCSIDALLDAGPPGATRTAWASSWVEADRRADEALRQVFAVDDSLSEPRVARLLADHLPDGASVTVSSSMPVRDFEWYGGLRASAHSNRGANGIDGVTSTALGRALARTSANGVGAPEFVLIGDLAFVHDSNALVALRRRGVDLRIVVVDNDGGGIFSFLPQASLLSHERFEQLFGTPLGTDVLALSAAHGLEVATARTATEFVAQLARAGPWVMRVSSDRQRNVEVHARLHDAVRRALG